MRSIKVDEETYKLLLKLKYEHAMRGVKLTFSDLVKGLLMETCHFSKGKKRFHEVCKRDMEEAMPKNS